MNFLKSSKVENMFDRLLSFSILLTALGFFDIQASSGIYEISTVEKVNKKALIFGVTGQDGAYLSELLLSKGYEVHGVQRRTSFKNTSRIDELCLQANTGTPRFFLHYGDLNDTNNIITLIKEIQPDEVYNLAAQSHVKVSFELPEYTAEVDAIGPLRILDAIKQVSEEKKIRYYQASTSELFGMIKESPQSEDTPFHPRSPYGVSKLFAYWITINYREAYGFFACNGILFNHESPLREETFVTRKITMAASRYKVGLQDVLYIGNLDSKRDWGYAKDYVEAMWLILQQDKPDDYVIATGESHSVREFIELAYRALDIEIEWKGQAENECGIDKKTGKTIVKVDPKYYRPSDVDSTVGNAEKALRILNWKPKTSFHELLKIMVDADYQIALKEAAKKIQTVK